MYCSDGMASPTVVAAVLVAGFLSGSVASYLFRGSGGDSPTGAVSESEQRYRTLAENFPRGSVALFDRDLRYELATGGLFDYIEHAAADFEGRQVTDVYRDTFQERHLEEYLAVFDGEEATFEFPHGDRYYRKHLVPIVSDGGHIEHGMEMTRDIMPLREREQALRESEQRYRTLAEYFPRGVVSLFDEDLRYTLTSGGVFDYLDLEPADFEGYTVEEIHSDGYVEQHREKFERCLEGESASFEFSHGGRVYRTRLVPVGNGTDTVRNGMSLTTDITDLKERERKLQQQNERLEEFANLLSHDLRNPLQVAKGRPTLVADETDSEHVDHVQNALDRIDRLIEDVLAMARQGLVEEPAKLHLEQLASDTWETVETKDATLEVTGDTVIHGDERGLARLFENLFRNAVDHAGPAATVTVSPTDAGFAMCDDGPGIPHEERDAVLEKGYTTDYDGTGFGLAIVREVARAHGWEITVEAGPDGGARFAFDVDGGLDVVSPPDGDTGN